MKYIDQLDAVGRAAMEIGVEAGMQKVSDMFLAALAQEGFGEERLYRLACRVTRTLISLGRKELQDIVDEGKPIDIDCQFCDQIYRYTPEEIAEILKEL